MPPALFVSGKLGSQGRVAAVIPGKLLHVQDGVSALRFLVDTGASFSLFPHKSSATPSGPSLTGANGQVIPCWGERTLTLSFSGRSFTWTFLLAAVDFPILGADFLRHFRLVVDLASGQVLDTVSLERFRFAPESGESNLLAVVASIDSPYRSLICQFQDVANEGGKLPDPVRGVVHRIETDGHPVNSKFRRLDPDRLAIAKKDFFRMESEGICRRSNSTWASPLHMVPKPDGTWRPCGDYRRLNLVTKSDKYPLPNMLDMSSRLSGCKVFSKIDLRKGYWQIQVHPDDIPKTAIITPFGLWEFMRMPFGLKNAGSTFQRAMDDMGNDLDFVFTYLDDMCVASPDQESHLRHLEILFERLRRHGFVLNLEKCEFGKSSVQFLGHDLSSKGVSPICKHVKAIVNFQVPDSKKSLMSFLGLVNFYRRFIPSAAEILGPLTEALKGGPKEPFFWSPDREWSFQGAKAAVEAIKSLGHPIEGAELSIAVDASNFAIGGVLQQKVNSEWQPLAFFSKKLNSAQLNYSAFDRELLAIVLSLRHWRFMLEARQFHILTDHKPLTFALSRISEPWSARQQRSLGLIAEYTSDIRHIAGKDNIVADAMLGLKGTPFQLWHLATSLQSNCPHLRMRWTIF